MPPPRSPPSTTLGPVPSRLDPLLMWAGDKISGLVSNDRFVTVTLVVAVGATVGGAAYILTRSHHAPPVVVTSPAPLWPPIGRPAIPPPPALPPAPTPPEPPPSPEPAPPAPTPTAVAPAPLVSAARTQPRRQPAAPSAETEPPKTPSPSAAAPAVPGGDLGQSLGIGSITPAAAAPEIVRRALQAARAPHTSVDLLEEHQRALSGHLLSHDLGYHPAVTLTATQLEEVRRAQDQVERALNVARRGAR